jgi:N-methylhydantoinase A/oxoprolinase/acetone carboxylase beta subunit
LLSVPVYDRADLAPGDRVQGPALIQESQTTTLVSGAFTAEIASNGYIVMERKEGDGA